MVAKMLSFVGRVLRRPWNAVGDEGAVVDLCKRKETGWFLEGGPVTVGFCHLRGDALAPPPGLSVGGTQDTRCTGERDKT